ncbi:MAG: AEC family transporter [Spirochaetota bacterium]
MDYLPPSVSQSLILFVLMGAGFVAGKAGILQGGIIKGLSRFLLDFTLPALVIHSMQRPFSPELRNQAMSILGFSFIIYATAFPMAYFLTSMYRKAGHREKGVHRFAMCFSNVGFMGFPVAESLLGRESLFMVSVYNIPFQLLAFSVGTIMVAGRASGIKGEKFAASFISTLKVGMNPAVLAAIAGFIFFLLSVRIPEPLSTAVSLLGATTTPLSMALIGAVLANTRLGPVVDNPRLWITTGYRLVLHPLAVLAIARVVGLSGLELSVPVLMAAMPVAANTTILAGVYGGDEVTASGLVFVSTAVSLLTIPILGGLVFG